MEYNKQVKNKPTIDVRGINNFDDNFKKNWIEKNKKLACAWARKYASSYQMPEHLEAMIQAGIQGLLKGLDRFDETKGNAKVSTICSNWARAAIQAYIKEQRYSFSVPINAKIQPSFTEIEESHICTEDISIAIENEDSRLDHDLYEYLNILTPLQKEALLYKNKVTDTLEDRSHNPLVQILAHTAEMKLKHFYKIEN